MKTHNRITRINDEILREVAELIRAGIKDPRLQGREAGAGRVADDHVLAMTSVVKVDTTVDLKHCKIYVSVLGDEKQKARVMEGLKNASGFIRRQIAEKVNLRNTPELKFILDDSLEYGMKLSKLIDEVNKDAKPMTAEEEEEDAHGDLS